MARGWGEVHVGGGGGGGGGATGKQEGFSTMTGKAGVAVRGRNIKRGRRGESDSLRKAHPPPDAPERRAFRNESGPPVALRNVAKEPKPVSPFDTR